MTPAPKSAPKTPAGPPPSVKIAVAVMVGLMLIGLSLFLILGRSATPSLATQKGFLGTRGTLFADINLIAEIILLVGLMVGYGLARGGNIPAHQYNQTAWVLFNIVLVMFIMTVSYGRQVAPGVPAKLLQAYYGVSALHSVLGSLTVLCGVYILLRMNRLLPKSLRIAWWKNLMRMTLGLYWAIGLLGVGTYYVWYIQPREAAGGPEIADATPAPAGKVIVPMANYEFVPKELTVPVGAAVIWRNDDPDPHTVTFDNKEFPAFGFEQGMTNEVAFSQTGDFFYYCEFHGSPGLHDMAGVIHVVPGDQIAAVPTSVPPSTPTPQPTAPPVSAASLGPIGHGEFRDNRKHNDEFDLQVTDLTPASGGEYHAWLRGEQSALRLGVLTPDESNTAELKYVDAQGQNLLALYSGFLVTVEAAGSSPASPSAQIVVGGDVPAGALGPARNLLVAAETTPFSRAFAVGLIDQVEELFIHTHAVDTAASGGDLASLDRHGEHMLALLEGREGANYTDLTGDGFVTDPGDGFGIFRYADAITEQAQAALAAPDATENVKLHAGHLLVLAENMRAWARQIEELALAAHDPATPADQKRDAARQAFTLARHLLNGVDANGNGVVEPTPGEGGAFTLYAHSQYLAAMGALTDENLAATAAAPTTEATSGAPAATQTPAPSPTPAATATPGPAIITYRNFDIVPAETTIKAGTRVVFVIKDSLHQPYNFTPPNVFEAPPDLGDGQTITFTFNEPGTVTLLCGYHSRMQATLIVTP